MKTKYSQWLTTFSVFQLFEKYSRSKAEALVAMGYNRQEIEDSLSQVRYDDVFATYLLLGRKSTDVSSPIIIVSDISLGYYGTSIFQ